MFEFFAVCVNVCYREREREREGGRKTCEFGFLEAANSLSAKVQL